VILDLTLFVAGIVLAWLTVSDVFETVVVPGGSRASLQVTRRIGMVLLAMYKLARGPRRGISSAFAPLVLVSSFVLWMALLALAFGLMAFGARSHFNPPLSNFGDAIYEAGGALLTIGLSPHYPGGAGRWIILASGFCGLAVITMAVTYLLEVQSSIARRDIGIIKLNTSAGDPPSALTLLERFAAIGNRHALPKDLQEGRNWCATVRQSHTTHPSLIYFRSTSTGSGWPATLGALLDLALIAEHLIDDDALYGPAILLREEGTRMATQLARIARLTPAESKTDESELEQVAQRLASSGYELRANYSLAAMASQRTEHMSCVDALAEHLGRGTTVLIRQS
jgi:ion channel